MKIQLYMNIKSFCYNINTNGNIYIIISNKTQSLRRMCHKTCAHILQRKAANVTTPPPQQAQRAIEHDSPQHPQRRWCSPRGCPFASVRKIEVPRIFYMSCLVLVTVSLFVIWWNKSLCYYTHYHTCTHKCASSPAYNMRSAALETGDKSRDGRCIRPRPAPAEHSSWLTSYETI